MRPGSPEYLSSKDIINQSFSSECCVLDVAPPRSDFTGLQNTMTLLFEARQELLLEIYQESQDNHQLKKSIAYLDSRISCLVQLFHGLKANNFEITDHKKQLYASLISVLQTEPVHYARLLINGTLKDRIRLIQIASEYLFQKTDRDEYLMLTLIHVIICIFKIDFIDA
jgi:hypothetical protein